MKIKNVISLMSIDLLTFFEFLSVIAILILLLTFKSIVRKTTF